MTRLLSITAVLIVAQGTYAQWQPDARLTIDSHFSATPFNNSRTIATSGDVLHVVSFDERDGNREIYYKRSPDAGTSWGFDTRLTFSPAASDFPSIAASGSTVHLVFEDCRDGNWEIYYKRSTDGGMRWGPDLRLTNNWAQSFLPSLSVSGSVVHVVWYDTRDGNREIYYKRSPDGGTSWGFDTRLTNNWAASQFAAVAADGSDVHVTWEENRDGNPEVYYKRSADGGLSWGADTRLTNNPATSLSPSIAASESLVHVAWSDRRDGNDEIYDKFSTDGGTTWTTDHRLTSNPAVSQGPSVAVSCLNVHVVWFDERDGNLEIYYKRSTDRGLDWEPDTRLTFNPFRSIDTTMAVSGSSVHVVWTDARDGFPGGVYNGNYEIYYKRDLTGNPRGADLNCDGSIDTIDLGILLGSWTLPPQAAACGGAPGSPGSGPCPADLNHDGYVDTLDLGMLLSSWTF